MTGTELINNIRKIKPSVKVIYFDNQHENETFANMIKSGADEYINKPIKELQFHEAIENLIEEINKEKNLEANHQLITSILNAQDNILMVYDNNVLTFCNDAFLNFFYVDSVETFKQVHSSMDEVFMHQHGFFNKSLLKENESWLDYMAKETAENRVVIMIRRVDFEPRAFVVKVSPLPPYKNKKLVSFTDITEITIETKKNEYNAIYDNLTKIYNRSKFNELLDEKIKLSKRYNLPLSVILFDIDFFKIINDTFGHLGGDKVLTELAELINNNIRNTDVFARWGGEEFIIIAPLTPLKDAKRFAEKLRVIIEKHDFEDAGSITCSFGVTQYVINETEHKLLARTDKALYEAKNNGRNIVVAKSGDDEL
jgi:diguanylate cyclase (GGDEF)-like protein